MTALIEIHKHRPTRWFNAGPYPWLTKCRLCSVREVFVAGGREYHVNTSVFGNPTWEMALAAGFEHLRRRHGDAGFGNSIVEVRQKIEITEGDWTDNGDGTWSWRRPYTPPPGTEDGARVWLFDGVADGTSVTAGESGGRPIGAEELRILGVRWN